MSVGKTAAMIARRAHKRVSGVSVSYIRGLTTITPMATIGATRRDQQSTDGFVERKQIRDFLIDVAELIFDGGPSEPELDDVIEETDDAVVYVYRLVSPGGSEEPFRYSDRHRLIWRLHVELIEQRAAV